MADATTLARDLVNERADVANPDMFEAIARDVGASLDLQVCFHYTRVAASLDLQVCFRSSLSVVTLDVRVASNFLFL